MGNGEGRVAIAHSFQWPFVIRKRTGAPPHPSPSADGLKKAPARATLSPKGERVRICKGGKG